MARRQFGSVRKLPSGRFQARYRLPSGRMVAATHTFRTKGDATRYLSSIETDLARGTFVDPNGARTTLAEWAEQWLARPGKRPASLVRDRQALDVWLPALGDLTLATITAYEVQCAVDARATEVAPSTLRRDFATLKALLSAAADVDMLARSPARRTKLPNVRPPARVTVGPAELRRLVAEVPARYRTLVLVAAVLGLRWSEAVGLRRGDVDFEAATLTVAQSVEELAGHVRLVPYGKTRTSLRTMSVPPFVLDALRTHVDAYCATALTDDLLFVGPRAGILRRNFVKRVLRPAAERAGLPPSLTFHGLRHIAVSAMADAGVPYHVTQARAGHASARMTVELYSHRSSEADRAAAQALEGYFGEALHVARFRETSGRLGSRPKVTG